jgi:hypothetical protein
MTKTVDLNMKVPEELRIWLKKVAAHMNTTVVAIATAGIMKWYEDECPASIKKILPPPKL